MSVRDIGTGLELSSKSSQCAAERFPRYPGLFPFVLNTLSWRGLAGAELRRVGPWRQLTGLVALWFEDSPSAFALRPLRHFARSVPTHEGAFVVRL
jgi:hypothetical protein